MNCLVSGEIGVHFKVESEEKLLRSGEKLAIIDNPVRFHFFYQILDGDDEGRPPKLFPETLPNETSPAHALVKKKEMKRNPGFIVNNKSCLRALCQSKHKVF